MADRFGIFHICVAPKGIYVMLTNMELYSGAITHDGTAF